MRNIVANDDQGVLSFSTHSQCADDHVYSVQHTRPGYRRAARGNIVYGDHVHATAYRAYDYSCRGQSVKGKKIPSAEWCNGQWVWGSLASYEGYPAMTAYDLVRPYIASGGYPNVPTSVIASARNRALASLNRSDVNLGQTIGELGETGQLIASTTVNLLRALNSMRKGKMGDAAFYLGLTKVSGHRVKRRRDLGGGNVVDVLSDKTSTMGVPGGELHNRWLEYQYGWKPLLSDIYNASQSISDAFAKPTGLASVLIIEEETKDLSSLGNSRYDVEGTATVGVQIGLKYRVADERVAGLSTLGLTNPLSLAWELLPLSFVIDWFVSVGDFLHGYGAHHGLQYVSGYETHFVRSKGHKIVDNYYPLSGYTGGPATYTCNAKAHRRYPSGDWPTPGIGVSLDLNLSKVTSLLALAKQRGY